MSAPNQGRQSPDPERQDPKQQQEPSASDPNEQIPGGQKDAKTASDEQKGGLESNPRHPLQGAVDDKFSKTQGK